MHGWWRSTRRAAIGLAVVTGMLAVAGCATPVEAPPDAPPAAVLVADRDLVTTVHPMTVLDRGEGAMLCGAVAQSLPPQCGGTPLIGWDWDSVAGHYDEHAGVRWGEFIVTGRYDLESNTFTVVDSTPGEGYEWPPRDEIFPSRCAEPPGGWHVVDESRTTERTRDAAVAVATRLDGFAFLWVDHSLNPASDPEVLAGLSAEEQMWAMNDPMHLILNVAVTHDPTAAERAIREVWGGMLCISGAHRTEAELQQIAAEISRGDAGVIANVDAMAEEVIIGVTFDDGSLQRRFDAEYGPGLVTVTSVLQPVS